MLRYANPILANYAYIEYNGKNEQIWVKSSAWVKHASILLILWVYNSIYPSKILQEFQVDPRKKAFFATP